MAFATYADSVEDSRPIEIYTITLGPNSWYYTSTEGIVSLDGVDYLPIPISREAVQQSQEEQDQALVVTLPATESICRFYIASVPGDQGRVKIERYQIPDGGTPERIVIYDGAIQTVSFEQQGTVGKLSLQALNVAFSRAVPRDGYSSVCNHVLYDARCQVVEATYRTTQEVLSISGNTLTIENLDLQVDGYYTAGFVEITGSQTDFRVILKHVGEVVTVPLPFANNPTGTTVRVYAGCGHIASVCKTKFNNLVNFGGFPFVPHKNPFSTGLK